MAQTDNTQGNSSRAYALARRKALSGSGKAALQPAPASGGGSSQPSTTASSGSTVLPPSGKAVVVKSRSTGRSISSGRAASLARRRDMSTKGKTGVNSSDRTRTPIKRTAAKPAATSATVEDVSKGCGCGCNGTKDTCKNSADIKSAALRVSRSRLKRKPKKIVNSDSCRAGALARRKALSTRGKAGISKSGMSSAQTARASNPGLSSRELARALRDQNSRKGSAGQKKSASTGRMRPARKADNGAAQDAPWKVGASDTSHGQTVTGTMVGRTKTITGEEPGTCRDVTGTEYLGADIFKEFCQAEPAKAIQRGSKTSTVQGNNVTGNQVGRSQKVTGDEPGTCKNVTGTEYVDAGQSEDFCGTTASARPQVKNEALTERGEKVTGDNVGRSEKVTGDETGSNRQLTGTQYMQLGGEGKAPDKVPAKVGRSATLSGGNVTGSMIGRSEHVTGDEPGSCRNVTGDDYIGEEQFGKFCQATPERTEKKVGVSRTLNGGAVTGTMTGRSDHVTGDEPGTCKTVTGTPYAGAEQYRGFCETEQTNQAVVRMQKNGTVAGSVMTGLQPAVGGKMTGDSKGVCETVSGTPYIGRDQMSEACPATPAEPGSPDFPQVLGDAVGQDFSVNSPARSAQEEKASYLGVTGSSYEQGSITGPFGMATGKVTGTEEARFNRPTDPVPVQQAAPETSDARPVSRVTGEGMAAGQKITGDDWDRGDRVTGTEGASSIKRNPTVRGVAPNAMSPIQKNRNEDIPAPVSRVTGGSGNTENGSLITYSGGARG